MSPFLKIATGALALLAGWASEQWSTTSLFVLLLTSLVIPSAYGALAWFGPPRVRAADGIDDPDFLANTTVDGPPPPPPLVPSTDRKTSTSSGSTSAPPRPSDDQPARTDEEPAPAEMPLPPDDEPAESDVEPATAEVPLSPVEGSEGSEDDPTPGVDDPATTEDDPDPATSVEHSTVKVESPPFKAPKRTVRGRRK
jgi:hypothetical protein